MELDGNTLLNARYVIDGVMQDLTPAQMLSEVRLEPAPAAEAPAPILDECPDPALSDVACDASQLDRYLEAVLSARERSFPVAFSAPCTRTRIATALIDAVWRLGHFGLGDLCLDMTWRWNDAKVGNLAAFYASVQAASEYVDALGVKLREVRIEPGGPDCTLLCTADLLPQSDEAEPLAGQSYRTAHPHMAAAALPSFLTPDPKSWIIYIPFDTSDYRLGGSLLAQEMHLTGDVAPQVSDPDYLIDCYEVVRELVEDGIVLSGATVGEGGLLAALKRMTGPQIRSDIDLSDLRRACPGTDPVRLLFSEVPGVLLQIRDIDFDYIDAELLLQDVVFYPLGHPVPGDGSVRVHSSAKTGIEHILEALVRNQGGEGED